MRVVETKSAKGSLRWIRSCVNDHTELFNSAIRDACDFRSDSEITWVSPLAEDEYAEYRDQDFIDQLGIELSKVRLSDFWPRLGPQWDALGKTSNGEIILVEAKANIPEILSSATGASGESKILIEESLLLTKNHLGVAPETCWSGTLYQITNRYAHLHLLRNLNDIPAYMIFVYFTGDKDVDGPKTDKEWKAATTVAKGVLGLRKRHKLSNYAKDVYVDVSQWAEST